MLVDPIAATAGAFAGVAVDLSLFPIDTIKTRLQAPGGFLANGGWSGIYKGIGSVATGSAPSGAIFFMVYETANSSLLPRITSYGAGPGTTNALTHMMAASAGELAACIIRVPTEVVKQRAQAMAEHSSLSAFKAILAAKHESVFRGLYRGFGITIMREIPFTMLQFPLYEAMKRWRAKRVGKPKVNAFEAAVCGCVAGGVGAGFTTPLDVLKTRIMLHNQKVSPSTMLKRIVANEGAGALLRGIGPRILWISAGGAVFLGAYELAKDFLIAVEAKALKKD